MLNPHFSWENYGQHGNWLVNPTSKTVENVRTSSSTQASWRCGPGRRVRWRWRCGAVAWASTMRSWRMDWMDWMDWLGGVEICRKNRLRMGDCLFLGFLLIFWECSMAVDGWTSHCGRLWASILCTRSVWKCLLPCNSRSPVATGVRWIIWYWWQWQREQF
jgi:hypothetical protein